MVSRPRILAVDAAGNLADLRMQRAAERDVHLLEAAADAKDRHPARDAGLRQRQCNVVAVDVVGLMSGARFDVEARRMDIGPGPGQDDAVDHVEQGTNLGDFGAAGEHQGHGTRDLGNRAQVALSDHLDRETIFDAMGVSDHANHGPSHY